MVIVVVKKELTFRLTILMLLLKTLILPTMIPLKTLILQTLDRWIIINMSLLNPQFAIIARNATNVSSRRVMQKNIVLRKNRGLALSAFKILLKSRISSDIKKHVIDI